MRKRPSKICPTALVLFLTRRCNSRCPHCLWILRDPNFFYTSADMDMPLERAKQIIDRYYNLGVRNVLLQAEGEVLQYKYFEDIVIYCLQKKFHGFGLATNGIELDKYVDFILHNIKYVAISLDGYDATSYIAHRGCTEIVFNKIINNIQMLVQKRKETKSSCSIHITSVIHNENFKQSTRIVELVESLGVDEIKFSNFHPVGNEHLLKPVSSRNLVRMHRIFYKRRNKIKIKLPRQIPNRGPFYCYMLFRTALIGSEYYSSPCCRINTDPSWGTFSTKEDAHNSQTLMAFRKKFIRAKRVNELPGPCATCGRRSQYRCS